LTKSTKLINELFDNYVSNYLTSYGSPYLTHVCLSVCSWNAVEVRATRTGMRLTGLALEWVNRCHSAAVTRHPSAAHSVTTPQLTTSTRRSVTYAFTIYATFLVAVL